MPDDIESRGLEEAAEEGPRVREADDAAREAAAEAAAAQQRQAQRARREEGHARRGDASFAQAFLRFLHSRTDDEYLELLIGLLDRNVPSSVLLALVSLLDDDAGAAFREGVEVDPEQLRGAAAEVESAFTHLPPSLPDPQRIRQWVLLLGVAVSTLDAEFRERLSSANREADVWVRDALQATVLRYVLAPTPQHRVDAAALSVRVGEYLARRPLPPALDAPAA